MSTTQATPLRRVVGENVRYWRDYAGLSQEDLARRLRDYGLDWDRSQLGKAERGEREFTLSQVLLLAAALERPASDLIGTLDTSATRMIGLGDKAQITPDGLLRTFKDPDVPAGGWTTAVAGMQVPRPRDLDSIVRDADHDVEQRAARALLVSPVVLARAARERYGHSFTDQRDWRVERLAYDGDKRSLRALRGHVTRELVEELREAVEKIKRTKTTRRSK